MIYQIQTPPPSLQNTPKAKKKLIRCGGIIMNESLTHVVGVMNYESLDNQKWGLPKGHLKSFETIQNCAEREIFEETGLQLEITDETPYKKLNDTFYFIFVIKDNTIFRIHDHHEIAEVKWLELDTLSNLSLNRGLRKFQEKYQSHIRYLIPSKNAYLSQN